MVNTISRFNFFIIILVAILSLIPITSAADFTPVMSSNDTLHYNTSYSLDPGTSSQWELWIISGLLGLFLFLLSLRVRDNMADNEIDAIISIMSWIPIAYCAYASFNVDRLVGSGVTGTADTIASTVVYDYVMLQSHTIYSQSTIGIIMVIFLLIAIGNTIRIISLHKAFSGDI